MSLLEPLFFFRERKVRHFVFEDLSGLEEEKLGP